ncbi:MAG TPA: NAD-dependent epimerase/dehydratase family protein [Roseiarcus sp.]
MSRIFLAGASGVIGRRLTPLLLAHGHSVWAATRSRNNGEFLRQLGARPILVDVFDAEALATAVLEAEPEIVIHQLTDLAVLHDPARRSTALARNARIRDEGTRNLVAAGRKAGARRLIAQSIAWAYAPGPRPYGEDDRLDLNGEGDRLVSVRGVAALERQVLGAAPMEGFVLRYGRLYGPGSGADAPPSPPAVHVDAAAYAALLAIDHGQPGAFNVAEPNDEVSTDKATAALGWRADFRMDAA